MRKISELLLRHNPLPVVIRKAENMNFSWDALQQKSSLLFENLTTAAQSRLAEWNKKLSPAPAINITENGNSFKIEAELAGLDPKNVEIEIGNDFLTLKGERKEETETTTGKGGYLRREISYGCFQRTIPLPDGADSSQAKALFNNGILIVTLPKKDSTLQQPKKIEIDIAA
jgi:HSP20 family protein